VPREVGEAWLKHYRQELPAVAFKASTQQQSEGLGKAKAVKGSKGKKSSAAAAAAGGSGEGSFAAAGSACLGADTLLQLLKNYARNAMGGKGSITVGVVGLPNVGKSSLINSLKRARVAQVGQRYMQGSQVTMLCTASASKPDLVYLTQFVLCGRLCTSPLSLFPPQP
jgi:nuclear GTP-binding protein